VDLCPSPFERNFVHGPFHYVDTASVFGIQVFDGHRVSDTTGFESMSLIPDDDEHALGVFAAAADMNQLASIHAIAVEYRVIHGLPKRKFNQLLFPSNTTGSSDEIHEPVRER
jgi:hypothetical protein